MYMRRYLTLRGTTPIALAASQISIGALILLVPRRCSPTNPSTSNVEPQAPPHTGCRRPSSGR
jgi:hypothetical protein